ncbi:MAG: hypothetical protein ABJK20_16935 [Halieaceae bacterium]
MSTPLLYRLHRGHSHAGDSQQGTDRSRERGSFAAVLAHRQRLISCLSTDIINQAEMDTRMDAGLDTFALDIPPEFQRDLLIGKRPTIQLNVDESGVRPQRLYPDHRER